MRRIYPLLAVLLAATCLFSCKSNDNEVSISQSSAKLIAGKWALQQQHFVQYIGAAKYMDTIYTASQNSTSQIQFNSDGTFASANQYIPVNTGSLNLTNNANELESNSSGTYNFTGMAFSISAPISGFGSDGAAFYGTTATTYAPVIAPISHLVQITLLTSARLTLHTEYVYSYTVNNISQTYKMENDYYYSK